MSGEEDALDRERLEAVLANTDALKAAVPTFGAGVDPDLWASLNRLLWLAPSLPLSEDLPLDDWLKRARASMSEQIEFYRNWPAGLGMGGPAAEAARLSGVGNDELAAIHAHASEVAELIRTLHPPRDKVDYEKIQPEDREARKWLQQKTVKAMVAGNWFGDAADALDFVERLYVAGAEKVLIVGESIRQEGKMRHADAIRIALPEDAERRAALFTTINGELPEDGYDPVEDTGQRVAYVWWD